MTAQTLTWRRYSAIYTLVFALTALGVFGAFLMEGRSLVWHPDGSAQYLPYMAYMGRYLREWFSGLFRGEMSHQMFDLTIGMGDDVGNVIRAHPLDFLSVFVPVAYTEYLYDLITLLRLYMAGLSFSLFCRYFSLPWRGILAGSLAYVFCGHAMHLGLMHPTFLSAMIVLPLLLLGAEKMLRREGFWLFTLMTFLGLMSNYYFMYMCSLGTAVYVLLRFARLHGAGQPRRFLSAVLPMTGAYLLGVGMAAATLCPIVLSLKGSYRFSLGQSTGNLLFYEETERYYRWFLDLIFPYRGTGKSTYLNYAVLVIPALAILAVRREKRLRGLKIALGLGIALLLVPFGAYGMAGFSNVTNRWVFLFSFLAALTVTVTWEHLTAPGPRERQALLAALLLYALLAVLDIFVTGTADSPLGLFLLGPAVAVLFWMSGRKRREAVREWMLVAIVMLSVTLNGWLGYSTRFKGLSGEFLKAGTGIERIQDAAGARLSQIDDDGFYRTDSALLGSWQENYSVVLGYRGTSMFNSLLSGPVLMLLLEQGNEGADSLTRIRSLGSRTVTEYLANVKYYLCRADRPQDAPYGFALREDLSDGKTAVYENTMPLGFGYCYDQVMTRKTYESLDSAAKEQAMLVSAVIDEVPEKMAQTKEAGDQGILRQTQEMPEGGGDVLRIQTGYQVRKAGAKVSFTYQRRAGYECYLSLDELRCGRSLAHVKVMAEGRTAQLSLRGAGYTYSLGDRSYLVRLGYADADGEDTVTLSFGAQGDYQLAGMSLLYVPAGSYEASIRALNETAMQDVRIETNRITGHAFLPRVRFMVFSLPYRKGWALTVDGEKTPLIRANTAYMGAVIPAGDHEITLTYETPGSLAGLCLAAISWLIFLLLGCRARRAGRRH